MSSSTGFLFVTKSSVRVSFILLLASAPSSDSRASSASVAIATESEAPLLRTRLCTGDSETSAADVISLAFNLGSGVFVATISVDASGMLGCAGACFGGSWAGCAGACFSKERLFDNNNNKNDVINFEFLFIFTIN